MSNTYKIYKIRYFENIVTGALTKDYIFPSYRAYWKEITKKEYDKKKRGE